MVNWKKLLLYFFMLSILCITLFVGDSQAQNLEYQAEDYEASIIPTIDGFWTTPNEWSDAEEYKLVGSLSAFFRLKKVTDEYGQLQTLYFLIEYFDDNTSDLSDYTNICLAVSDAPRGTPEGGEAPDENCILFNYKPYDSINPFKYYRGAYGGWLQNYTYNWGTDILIVESFNTSPLFDQTHLIVEYSISAPAFGINPDFWLRVAAYDATNNWPGSQIWPSYANVNVPDQWGVVVMHSEPIPEISIWTVTLMFLAAPIIIVLVRKMMRKDRTSFGFGAKF
jgi:hypothetical protein